MSDILRVAEILRTLQGEGSLAGHTCTILRLAGCTLECAYCDTAWARDPSAGGDQSIDELLRRVAEAPTHHVLVTGGEPLMQPGCLELLAKLCDAGHQVVLETSGALATTGVDPRVRVMLDVKAPGSGMEARNCWENLERLGPRDEVKLVLRDRADYEYARQLLAKGRLDGARTVHFSPVLGELEPEHLARWLLEDQLIGPRLAIQLHKLAWPDLG